MSNNKYWLRMNVKENLIDNYLFRFERLGEARLFGYILSTMNLGNMCWTYDKAKEKAMLVLLDCSVATIFNYLSLLCGKGILVKEMKGSYKINPSYIEYGKMITKKSSYVEPPPVPPRKKVKKVRVKEYIF